MRDPEKKVDESWKEQVDRERQQPVATEPSLDAPPPGMSAGAPPPGGSVRPGAPPAGAPAPAPEAPAELSPEAEEPDEPLFEGLVQSLAVQATMFLGATPDPRTGLVSEDLGQAKQLIDMIGMLERKTRGNLTAREAQFMQMLLRDLRMAYVQRVQSAQGGPAVGGAPVGPDAPPF